MLAIHSVEASASFLSHEIGRWIDSQSMGPYRTRGEVDADSDPNADVPCLGRCCVLFEFLERIHSTSVSLFGKNICIQNSLLTFICRL
jgi:hypothetical protein